MMDLGVEEADSENMGRSWSKMGECLWFHFIGCWLHGVVAELL